MQKKKSLKVALVHDYLREYGGAERVLEALHEIYPQAPVYVAFVDQQQLGIHWAKFQDWEIHQSWITTIPFYKTIFSPLRIFAPQFFRRFDLSKFDLIISSSNMYFAKAIKKNPETVHVSYCHTPPRSLYGFTTMTNWKKNPIIRVGGTLINHYLRVVDYQVSQKVDYFIANSKEVQRRIQKFYRRDSVVIYPPVDMKAKPEVKSQNPEYYLYVSRLAYSKHPELAVEVANQLKIPLKVAGSGGMESTLRQLAGSTVEILGSVSDDQLKELYSGAKALLYPVEDEDFGIVPVEAMGFGVPVIAHNSGGPKETIVSNSKFQSPNSLIQKPETKKSPLLKEETSGENQTEVFKNKEKNMVPTGILFDELTVEGLAEAIQEFEETKFDRQKIHEYALQFSKERFKKEIERFVDQVTG